MSFLRGCNKRRTQILVLAVSALMLPVASMAWSGNGNHWSSAPRSEALPNPHLTPGATDPRVTDANLDRTICRRGGYTRSVRPPESYTEPLKRRQIREYGYRDKKIWHYEEDHLVPLEVGGAPYSRRNLWPEPRRVAGGWGSRTKDALENRLHELVCSRQIPLATAQFAIAHDWIAAFKRYVGSRPADGRRYQWR